VKETLPVVYSCGVDGGETVSFYVYNFLSGVEVESFMEGCFTAHVMTLDPTYEMPATVNDVHELFVSG
jgi:hypothetical protein